MSSRYNLMVYHSRSYSYFLGRTPLRKHEEPLVGGNMDITVKLKTARTSRGITMVQLGDKIGCSKQYIYALEKGNIKLSYEMAVKIATALETTPDELFL